MRAVLLVVLVGCSFDTGRVECGDWICPEGTRCAAEPTEQDRCTPVTCGNGVLEAGEACDGDDLGDVDCVALGLDEGMPRCSADCRFDTTTCEVQGFTRVYSGAERIGALCGYDGDAGPVVHFAQPGAIVGLAAGSVTEVPMTRPVYGLACTRRELAVLSDDVYTYTKDGWIPANAFADDHLWTVLVEDGETLAAVDSSSTTDTTLYTKGSAGWSAVHSFGSSYVDRLHVAGTYAIAAAGAEMTVFERVSGTWSGAMGVPIFVDHLWGLDPTAAFIAGGNPSMNGVYRRVGLSWMLQPGVSKGPLVGRDLDGLFVLGIDARLAHYDGMVWSLAGGAFDDAWVAADGTFYGSRASDLVRARALWLSLQFPASHVALTGGALAHFDDFRSMVGGNDQPRSLANIRGRGMSAAGTAVFIVGAVTTDPSKGYSLRSTILPNRGGQGTPSRDPLEAVVAVSPDEAYAVGTAGALHVYRNGWQPQGPPIASVTLRGIARSPGGELVAVGDAGTILTSTDGAATWTAVASPTDVTLRGVWAGASRVFAVGDGGTIVHRDAGGAWSVMRSRTTRDLLAVHGTGDEVVAVGKGVIMRFDGKTWSTIRPPDPSAQLTSVQVAPRHVYIGSTSVAYVLYRAAR